MKARWKTNIVLSIFLIILSICSFWLVWESANNEPYLCVTRYDAVTQIILGTTFMVLWVQYILVVIYLIFRKLLSPFWTVSIYWVLLVLLNLHFCPFGYIGDVIKFRDIFNDFPITNTRIRIGSYYDHKDT